MKAEDIYEAMQYVRPEYLEESEMPNRKKRKLPRTLLIAAAIALGGIGVTAAVWSLRGAARADMGIERPIPEWKEYEVPAADEAASQEAPVPLGERVLQDVPENLKPINAVTLDSTLCSGDQLTAYLRVSGITPETGAQLEDRTCYWDIGGIERDWGGSCCDSLGVEHVAYDADSQTALVRLDISGLAGDVDRVYFSLRLWRGQEDLARYDRVEIPVTRSSELLSAEVDYTPAQGSYQGEMRAVQAQVFANHIDVDFEITSLEEMMPPISEDDEEDLPFHYYIEYVDALHKRVEEALAGATIQYKDGGSEVISAMPARVAGAWTTDSLQGKREEVFIKKRVTFQHLLNQAIDLSQVSSITIGGVMYPLDRKEYEAPAREGPARKDGPLEKLPEKVTLESVSCSGDELTAYLRVYDVAPELGAYLEDGACYWIVDSLENCGNEHYGFSVHRESYDEASRTALVELQIEAIGDVDRVYFRLALCHQQETVVKFAPVEIPVARSESLSAQLDYELAQGSYYGKIRAVQAEVFAENVSIDFEITPYRDLESAKPSGNVQDGPPASNVYHHEISDRVEDALESATFQYRDGRSELVAERIPADNMEWFFRSLMRSVTTEEMDAMGRVNFSHTMKKPLDLSELVSITVGGVVYPLN